MKLWQIAQNNQLKDTDTQLVITAADQGAAARSVVHVALQHALFLLHFKKNMCRAFISLTTAKCIMWAALTASGRMTNPRLKYGFFYLLFYPMLK